MNNLTSFALGLLTGVGVTCVAASIIEESNSTIYCNNKESLEPNPESCPEPSLEPDLENREEQEAILASKITSQELVQAS